MEVAHPDPQVEIILGEIFRHPFRQGRHEDPFVPFNPLPDFPHQVVHLVAGRFDPDFRVHESRGTDDLLHQPGPGPLQLVSCRRGGHVDSLKGVGLELVEPQGPVVQGGRQAEPVRDQGFLPGPVPSEHPRELGKGHVALVDEKKGFRGQVIHERGRGLPGAASRDVPRVVLDALAVPHLPEHFQVEPGALFQALGFEPFFLSLEDLQAVLQLRLDVPDRPLHVLFRGHIVAPGIDVDPIQVPDPVPPERIREGKALDDVPEEFHPDHPLVLVGGEDLHQVPPDPEGSPVKVDVVPVVLDAHEIPEEFVPVHLQARLQRDLQRRIVFRRPDAVYAGHARHDDHVLPFEERPGGRVPELVDVLVDGRVLLDVGVRGGQIGLRLVVIVITHEILYGMVGEKHSELVVQLGRQGLVVGDDQGGTVCPGDDVGHGEGFPGAGDADKNLVPIIFSHTPGQALDGLGLIPPGLEITDQMKQSFAIRHGLSKPFPIPSLLAKYTLKSHRASGAGRDDGEFRLDNQGLL